MWTKTYSQFYPNISPRKVWELWKDIDNWPSWHGDLDFCKLEGEFKPGNYFILKPKGIKPFRILLTDIEEMESMTDCTKFFGAKMYDTHSMEIRPDGIILKNKLVVKGPLKWFWILLVAKGVAKSVPQEMEALAKLAKM